MKRGYIARRLARRPVRKLRSFGASRAKPEINIGFNPLQKISELCVQFAASSHQHKLALVQQDGFLEVFADSGQCRVYWICLKHLSYPEIAINPCFCKKRILCFGICSTTVDQRHRFTYHITIQSYASSRLFLSLCM